jgi:excisionase family DNA binding protein
METKDNDINEKIEGFGYCDFHEEQIDEKTFEWKGCWKCYHFIEGKKFPYYTVKEVSKMLGISESTVRRWIKSGKLKGRLFEQGRFTGDVAASRIYFIEKESVNKVLIFSVFRLFF